jgi:hypothetical protein
MNTDSQSKKSNASSLQNTQIALGVVGAIIFGSLGFVGGIQYEKRNIPSPVASAAAGTAGAGAGGFAGRGAGAAGQRRAGVFGTVSAVSATSITVNETRTNSTQTLAITSATTVTNAGASASVSDIQVGDTAIIMTSASDTSTATTISINPSFGGGRGGFGAPSAAQGDPTDDSATTN